MKVWAPAAILIAGCCHDRHAGQREPSDEFGHCGVRDRARYRRAAPVDPSVTRPDSCCVYVRTRRQYVACVLKSRLQLCTAVNASNQRQFIGTELTDAGRQFQGESGRQQ